MPNTEYRNSGILSFPWPYPHTWMRSRWIGVESIVLQATKAGRPGNEAKI